MISKIKKARVKKDQAGTSEGTLKHVGGSPSDDWNNRIVHDTWQALWRVHSDAETLNVQFHATMAGLKGIAPRDELEGMMAAQLIAANSAAMECYRRAMIGDQTIDGRRDNLNQANKLSRTFTELLDALNRYRGKGQQKVTVEHVHVHSGGQALVGTVQSQGGGRRPDSKDQPHAKQIAYAPQPAVWGPDKARGAGANPRRCRTAGAECTEACHRALRRVTGTPSSTAATPPRQLQRGARSKRCCAA